MKIIVLYNYDAEHQRVWGQAFAKGLRAHGLTPEELVSVRVREVEADLVAFWGHKKHDLIRQQKEKKKDYLVMERGYFGDRHAFTSLGFNGLNGRAEFHTSGVGEDRWKKHGAGLLKTWRETEGDYILLVGQVPGDASHSGIVDINVWYEKTRLKLQAIYNQPVVFRPHPLSLPPNRRDKLKPLQEELAGAKAVVVFNSNTAVDAALAGIPVIAADPGCMAWSVASQNNLSEIKKPDRTQWLNELAYCQWSLEEVESGEAWEHLKRRYE